MSKHLRNAQMTDYFTKILSELDWSLTHLIIPGGGPPIIGLGAPIGGIPTIKNVIYYNIHTTVCRPMPHSWIIRVDSATFLFISTRK